MIKNNFRVIFLEVTFAKKKIEWITKLAQSHFDQNQTLHFFIDSEQASQFIDKILWSSPQMSFLPHSTKGKGLITISDQLDPNCHNIFNLTPNTLTVNDHTTTLYEFDDQTAPSKIETAKKKYSFYKKEGFHLINQ